LVNLLEVVCKTSFY
jgi:hypothetical protein